MAGPMGPTATGGKNTYLPRYGKIDRYGSDSSSATRRCDGDDLPLVPAHSLVAALRCSSRELLRSFCVLPGLPPTAHTVKECAGERLVSERDVAIFSPPSCSFACWLAFLLVACCCCFCSSCTTELPTAYVGYVPVCMYRYPVCTIRRFFGCLMFFVLLFHIVDFAFRARKKFEKNEKKIVR